VPIAFVERKRDYEDAAIIHGGDCHTDNHHFSLDCCFWLSDASILWHSQGNIGKCQGKKDERSYNNNSNNNILVSCPFSQGLHASVAMAGFPLMHSWMDNLHWFSLLTRRFFISDYWWSQSSERTGKFDYEY
jgi:hypothetical protein